MTSKEEHPKLPRLLPYNTPDFQHRLIWALDTERNSEQPKTLYELAVALHHHVLENYLYMIVNTENPAHVWSCLSDLAAVASAYHVLDRIENPTTFLEALPEWIMIYLGKCAVKLNALIINHQIDEYNSPSKVSDPAPVADPKTRKNSDTPKPKEKTQKRRPEYTSRYIAEKIPKALDLLEKGSNRLSVAAHERQVFAETLQAKTAGLSRLEAAASRKSKRRPDLIDNSIDEKQGDERSELQRDLVMTGMGYRVWERRFPSKRRK
jgi:hypothetical protein